MIYMFLSNNPSSGDINSSNLSCFNFEIIINFPFFDGDVPRFPSYCVYILQLIRFARVCSNVYDFNNRNLF